MARERNELLNSGQVKGSIKKLKFQNFMSCSYLECDVEPNLNLIIAPNGMGKSTIICGICLALGGNPKLLGRSEKMADYVKHDERTASVEVHMKTGENDEVVIIRLVIHSNNKHNFFINDQQVNKSELIRLVSSYNIQVDNPCVFLAQDKVKSFAEQNPVALLENTEKACSIELQETHDELKNLSEHDIGRGKRKEDCEKNLKSIEKELKALSSRVENFLRKEGMQKRIESLQQREIFIICEREERTLEKHQVEMNKAEQKVSEVMEELNKAERENQSKMEEIKQFQKEYKENEVLCDKIKSDLDRISKQRSINDMIRQSRLAYGEAKEDYEKWQEEVKKVETTLQEYQSKLAESHDACDSIEQEKASLRKGYEEILKRADDLKRDEIRMKADYEKLLREQQAIGDIDAQQRSQFSHRLQILRNATPGQHAVEAYQWIEEHKEQFQKPVYVPLLSMTMNDKDSAMYLENLISKRDLVMFICGCREDERLLTDSRHPWRINSTFITDHDARMRATETPLPERIRQFGFNRTAFQLFSAPLAVKAYLNSVAHLNDIPIGTKETENRLDEVCDTLKNSHRLFLTPELKMRIIMSAYRSDIVTQATDLRTNIYYLNAHRQLSNQPTATGNGDNESSSNNQKSANSLDEKAAKVLNDLKQLKGVQQKVAVKQDAIRTQLSNISTKEQQLRMVKHLINQTEQKLKQVKSRKPDLEAAKTAVQCARRDAIKKHVQIFNESIELIEKLESTIKSRTFARRRYQEASRLIWEDNERMSDIKEKLHNAKRRFGECQEEVSEVKQRMEEITRKLFNLCQINSTKENLLDRRQQTLLKDLKNQWTSNSIPSELEHVQEMLADERARLELASSDGTKSDVSRQSELLKQKENYQRKLEAISTEISTWRATMDSLLNKWLTPLEELISRINARYVQFFRKMGCCGEVELQKPEDKYDVSHYGIVILVKFHQDEPLRALTHKTQSGGERSVATMLYLMVLQELCSVPFCCVDEINQGMDEVNERRIVEMLVTQLSSTTSALSRTQYFLLTPKLLDSLQYADVTALCFIQATGNFDDD